MNEKQKAEMQKTLASTMRDFARAALEEPVQKRAGPKPILVGWLVSPHGEWKPNYELKVSFPAESLDWQIPVYMLGDNND